MRRAASRAVTSERVSERVREVTIDIKAEAGKMHPRAKNIKKIRKRTLELWSGKRGTSRGEGGGTSRVEGGGGVLQRCTQQLVQRPSYSAAQRLKMAFLHVVCIFINPEDDRKG